MARKTVWRKDRITSAVDEETGRRIVDWPAVKGITSTQRDALAEFERSVIGTTRAVIRMNKRHQQGTAVIDAEFESVPYRLRTAGIPTDLAGFYPEA